MKDWNYGDFNVNMLPVSTTKGMFLYPYENILYIKSDNQYTYIFLCTEPSEMKVKIFDKIYTSKSLKYYESLAMKSFFKISRSHIVNLKYIRSFHHTGASGHIVLADNSIIRVSKNMKNDLLEKLRGH